MSEMVGGGGGRGCGCMSCYYFVVLAKIIFTYLYVHSKFRLNLAYM